MNEVAFIVGVIVFFLTFLGFLVVIHNTSQTARRLKRIADLMEAQASATMVEIECKHCQDRKSVV